MPLAEMPRVYVGPGAGADANMPARADHVIASGFPEAQDNARCVSPSEGCDDPSLGPALLFLVGTLFTHRGCTPFTHRGCNLAALRGASPYRVFILPYTTLITPALISNPVPQLSKPRKGSDGPASGHPPPSPPHRGA